MSGWRGPARPAPSSSPGRATSVSSLRKTSTSPLAVRRPQVVDRRVVERLGPPVDVQVELDERLGVPGLVRRRCASPLSTTTTSKIGVVGGARGCPGTVRPWAAVVAGGDHDRDAAACRLQEVHAPAPRAAVDDGASAVDRADRARPGWWRSTRRRSASAVGRGGRGPAGRARPAGFEIRHAGAGPTPRVTRVRHRSRRKRPSGGGGWRTTGRGSWRRAGLRRPLGAELRVTRRRAPDRRCRRPSTRGRSRGRAGPASRPGRGSRGAARRRPRGTRRSRVPAPVRAHRQARPTSRTTVDRQWLHVCVRRESRVFARRLAPRPFPVAAITTSTWMGSIALAESTRWALKVPRAAAWRRRQVA